jgi:putative peptidoglycan lipid II flippase
MVKRLLALVNKKYGGIHEAAILLGLASFSSQFLGLIRDRALVSFVGPGSVLDVYYVSFRVPDLIFALFASLVSVTALVPILQTFKTDDETIDTKMQEFLNTILAVFSGVLILVCIVAYALMPLIMKFFVSDMASEMYPLVVLMSRIMLLSPIFFGLQNIFTSVTQLYKKFFVFALAPIVYNLGILFGVIVLYPLMGAKGLAYGVIIGAFTHMAIQVPLLYYLGFSFARPAVSKHWKTLKEVFLISIPRTITLSLSNITLFFITLLLIHISTGSVSLFNFALNVQSIPLMVIGLSYAVASFPTLVESYQTSQEVFKKTATTIGRSIIFWSLPCMALFIVLRAHIIRVIYGSTSFSWGDTRTTAALFALVTVSIVFQSLILLFVRMYYASGKTRFPLIFSILGSVLSVAIATLGVLFYDKIPGNELFSSFVFRFSTEDTRPELLFVGVGYVVGYLVTMISLCVGLQLHFNYSVVKEYGVLFLKTLLGTIGIAGVSYLTLAFLAPFFPLTSFVNVLMHGFISGSIGILFGATIFYLLKIEEFLVVIDVIKRHTFWKVKVIAPNESDL